MLKKIVLTGAVGVLGIGVLVVGNEILFLLKQSNTTEKIQPRSSNENNTGQFITLLMLTGLGAGGVGVVAGRVFLNKRQSGAVDSPSSDLKDDSVDSSTSESGESTYSEIKNRMEASSAYGKAKDTVSNLPPASEVAERIKASSAYGKAKDAVSKLPPASKVVERIKASNAYTKSKDVFYSLLPARVVRHRKLAFGSALIICLGGSIFVASFAFNGFSNMINPARGTGMKLEELENLCTAGSLGPAAGFNGSNYIAIILNTRYGTGMSTREQARNQVLWMRRNCPAWVEN